MLNGIAPVLIFSFPIVPPDFSKPIPGLPGVSGFPELPKGIPIPLYLDEKLSGVISISEEKNVDMDTQPYQTADSKNYVKQRAVNNTVTINFVASRNSIVLSVLLAFTDLLFQRAVNGAYSVSYFNGSTLIFNGLVHSFTDQTGNDDDLRRLTLVLVKTLQQTISLPTIGSVPNITGTVKGPG